MTFVNQPDSLDAPASRIHAERWRQMLTSTARALFESMKFAFSMLSWAMIFLIIALIAAIFGFGGIVGGAIGLAKVIFFISIVLFMIACLMGRKTPGA